MKYRILKFGKNYEFHLDIINTWIINRYNDIDIGGYEYDYR